MWCWCCLPALCQVCILSTYVPFLSLAKWQLFLADNPLFSKIPCCQSYVYWTMHHLDSWVKRDQLDATSFIITLFNAQRVSDVNTSILRSLQLIRWVTSWVVSGSMCVGVTLQCGYDGVVSVCRLKPAYRYHTTPAKPQCNTNTHRTRSIQPIK